MGVTFLQPSQFGPPALATSRSTCMWMATIQCDGERSQPAATSLARGGSANRSPSVLDGPPLY
jgi:hypothetical protein